MIRRKIDPMERALQILEHRDYSRDELVRKLIYYYSRDISEETATKVCEMGLIDDRKYARRVADEVIEKKHFGKYRVRMELLSRGIYREIVDEIIEETTFDNEKHMRAIIEKRYMPVSNDEKYALRAFKGLSRAGYSYSEISAFLKTLNTDEENFPKEKFFPEGKC